jgi:hypothetical protein
MKLFLSHSNRDAVWVHAVNTQLEKLGITVYLAEQDLQPGHPLNEKLQRQIDLCDAMVVLLTETAAVSPIVREEIGYAIKAGKLVVPLVALSVVQNPALLGMLNGSEYILFDIDNPKEGLLTLAKWAQDQVHNEQQAILRKQLEKAQVLADQEADSRRRAERQLELQASELVQLQLSNDALIVLLLFVSVVGAIAILGSSSQ